MSESIIGGRLPVNIVKEPRDAQTEIRYQFSVRATEITALSPEDYSFGTMGQEQIRNFINPADPSITVRVTIENDLEIEGSEEFQLELFVAEQPHFLLGNITRVTVTITDDDRREDEGKEGGEGGRERGRREGREEEEEGCKGREEDRKEGA